MPRPDYSYKTRNFLRDLTSHILNKGFPGSQRIATTRDSLGFQDSVDMYSSCGTDDSAGGSDSSTPLVGDSKFGE